MRAAKYKHFAPKKKNKNKCGFKLKYLSFIFAFALVSIALIVPTNALAPNVDAVEDSMAVPYPTNTTLETAAVTTEAETQAQTTQAEQISAETEETTAEPTEAVEKETQPPTEPATQKTTEPVEEKAQKPTAPAEKEDADDNSSGSEYLIKINYPDFSYSPKPVQLSEYDRAKLERLVMGEAGTMGYNGCALVAQAIRDAMNRSNTTSIDTIIVDYKYSGSTSMEPSKTVKDAVSFIFDQNGSAVQHRILVFYTGTSDWHETQEFIIGMGNVRFFDIWD